MKAVKNMSASRSESNRALADPEHSSDVHFCDGAFHRPGRSGPSLRQRAGPEIKGLGRPRMRARSPRVCTVLQSLQQYHVPGARAEPFRNTAFFPR